MKKLSIVLMLVGMLTGFTSCGNSEDEVIIPSDPGETRAEEQERPFYWCEHKKHYFDWDESTSWVLYHAADEETVLAALAEKGVDVKEVKLFGSGVGAIGFASPEAKAYWTDCKRAEVKIHYKEAMAIPEVLYATPYVSLTGISFPMTNLICVYTHRLGELKKEIKKYGVELLGYFPGLGSPAYYIYCTKESLYPVLEVSHKLYDTGLFDGLDIAFLSARLCDAPEPGSVLPTE